MFDANILWKKRLKEYTAELRRYLKYIFNDHLKIVLFFGLGGGIYYYQQWLNSLPENFPTPFILSLIVAFVITRSPIQALIKEADLVFLLPLETKLKAYFNRAILFSLSIQIYVYLVVMAILAPLYFSEASATLKTFLIIVAIGILIKIFNIHIAWKMNYFFDRSVFISDQIVRFSLNFVTLFLLFANASVVYLIAPFVIYVILYVYFYSVTRKNTLNWDYIIKNETKRMMAFYRIANMFTDVPIVQKETKRRKWLDWISGYITRKQSSTYVYLFTKTVIRSNEYIGLVLRLAIVGGLLCYYLPGTYSYIFIIILFLNLTGFQLIPLWGHHKLKLWVDLYPVSFKDKISAFLRVIIVLQTIHLVILLIFISIQGDILTGLLAFCIGAIFNLFYVFVYMKKKILKLENISI